ncbi:sugar ABC transporter substrate-binding protein [Mycolicibacterium setense]|jgi:ribose transport system substrate-binding protein
MTSRPWFGALFAVSVVILGLVGCGRSEDDAGITIGYSTYTLSNPFFSGMLKGLQQGTQERGYKLVTANANGDPAQQVTDMQNLISRGVDYILLTPADGKAIAPGIAASDAAGVPVISVPDRVDQPIAVSVAMDEVDTGKKAGEFVTAAIAKKNGQPVGNVVQIEGVTGIPSAMARKEGFRSVIAQSPGLKIVASQDGGFDTDQSYKVMVDILQANPKIDAVFATNDAEAIGVTAALKSQGRYFPVGHPEHIILIGADGSKPVIEAIRGGVQDATMSLNPIKSAKKAVEVVADLQAGRQVSKEIIWPTQLITTENIKSPEVAAYGIWSDEL